MNSNVGKAEVKNSDDKSIVEVHGDGDPGWKGSRSTDQRYAGEDDQAHIEQDLMKNLERAGSLRRQQTLTAQQQQILTVPTGDELQKYYHPKVVSIGPYHYGKPDLKPIQKLKLDFAKDLFSRQGEGKNKLKELYNSLSDADMLETLRSYYDEKSMPDIFSNDQAFANMMLLDGCFILYYILFRCGIYFETKVQLLNHQLASIPQDLFMLENQIPFKVLETVKNHLVITEKCEKYIRQFIIESTPAIATGNPNIDLKSLEVHHLLHLLRLSLTINCEDAKNPPRDMSDTNMQQALPKVKELMKAGIRFKTNETTSLCKIDFSKHWWGILSTATVRLPPILLEEASTKYFLLNLVAYEASSHKQHDMWVTAYICLLNSLISGSKDVKHLRDAGVFADSDGTDTDIKYVIREIASAGRVDKDHFWKTRIQIQEFYDHFKGRNILISQLKDRYFNSPWSAIALGGAILALFLSGVQTYFTVWSLKGECDHLCKFLKLNHHL